MPTKIIDIPEGLHRGLPFIKRKICLHNLFTNIFALFLSFSNQSAHLVLWYFEL